MGRADEEAATGSSRLGRFLQDSRKTLIAGPALAVGAFLLQLLMPVWWTGPGAPAYAATVVIGVLQYVAGVVATALIVVGLLRLK